MIAYVYALIDPRNGEVRYIGETINPKGRYNSHVNYPGQNTNEKNEWVQELRLVGLLPEMEILEEVSKGESVDAEARHIQEWHKRGARLFNSEKSIRSAQIRWGGDFLKNVVAIYAQNYSDGWPYIIDSSDRQLTTPSRQSTIQIKGVPQEAGIFEGVFAAHLVPVIPFKASAEITHYRLTLIEITAIIHRWYEGSLNLKAEYFNQDSREGSLSNRQDVGKAPKE